MHCSTRSVLQVRQFHAREKVSELLSERRAGTHLAEAERRERTRARPTLLLKLSVRLASFPTRATRRTAGQSSSESADQSRALFGKKSLDGGAATLAPSQSRTLYEA